MSSSRPSPAPVPRTYAELRRRVEAVIGAGRRQVEAAWVQTYHETGRLIHEHVLLRKDRADYGAQVYARLSADVGVSGRTLRECVQFYRRFPIWRPVAKLGWNQCRLLCQVGDESQRGALLAEMRRGEMPTVDLKKRVRSLNAASRLVDSDGAPAPQPDAKLLKPRRGTPGVFRVTQEGTTLAVDLGFTSHLDLTPAQARGLQAGGFVRFTADGEVEPAPNATRNDLYTYAAEVTRVVDGDTLWVKLYLEPRRWLKEKVRLRGIDCPEMATPEGRAAKRFVETLIAQSTAATVTTTKPDKWDRYLADVFLRRASGEGQEARGRGSEAGGDEGIFLNNELLAHGHARRMDEYALTDWDGKS
jgi:endonuclease YncB( thermonuclease family)